MQRLITWAGAHPILTVVLALMLLGGITSAIGGEPAPAPTATSASPSPTPNQPTPNAERSPRCEPVTPSLAQAIVEEGAVDGSGIRVAGTAWAVRSKDFESMYFVAVPLTIEERNREEVGVWATNRLDGAGLTFSVSGFAKRFTRWPDGSKTQAEIRAYDDGADLVEECLP